MAATLVEPLAEVVDTFFAGRLGVEELGALTACHAIFSLVTWLFNFLLHVSTVQIAQLTGAHKGLNPEQESRAKLSLSSGIVLGLCVSLLLLFLEDVLLVWLMGLQGELLAMASEFYLWRAISMPAVFCVTSGIGVLRGLSLMSSALVFLTLNTLLNVALTSIFVLQGLGLAGIAQGTLGAYALCAISLLIYLFRSHFSLPLQGWLDFSRSQIQSFGSKSLNQFFRTLAISATFLTSAALVSRQGVEIAAAYQIVLQVWLLQAYVMDGFAVTASSESAQLVGKNQIHRFKLLAWQLQRLSAGVGLVFSVVFFVFPEIVQIFSEDEDVLRHVGSVWWLICLMQVPNSLAFLYDGLLFGLGNFALARKRMVEGVLLGYLPFAAWASWIVWRDTAPFGEAGEATLLCIWLGCSALNLYRMTVLGAFLRRQGRSVFLLRG